MTIPENAVKSEQPNEVLPGSDNANGVASESRVGCPVTNWETDFDHTVQEYGDRTHEIWDELRESCPVAHSERFGGMWLPTRHAEIAEIAANKEGNYTSFGVVVSEYETGGLPAPIGPAPPITSDPPFHKDARRLLLEPFAPKKIAALEPFTRAFCNGLIDEILKKTPDEDGYITADVAVEFAQHIPVRVIAEMLGFPPEDGERFRTFIKHVIEEPIVREIEWEDTLEFYIDNQIQAHIDNPRPKEEWDLVDHLLNVEIYGNRLEPMHVRGTVVLLLIAGIDTTWSAIGSSLWHLAKNPSDLERFRSEPEVQMFALEEFLRAYAPVTMARKVAQDHELAGRELKEGDWLLLPFPSANRDPEFFEDPDQFIIDRKRNRHAAFGLGIHRCLGSNMARMELRVALETFTQRIGEFELVDEDAVRFSTGQIRGPRELPMRLKAASNNAKTSE